MELSSRRRDRGATLVEYALILALVVVAAVASIQFLTNQSEAEVANQADCVSTRPPPPSCQARAVTTTTTTIPPETTTTIAPETTTTESTTTTTSTTAPPSSTTSTTAPPEQFDLTLTGSTESFYLWWRAFGAIYVVDADGAPARGVTVVLTIQEAGQSGASTVSCQTSNAAGGPNAGRCSVASPWMWRSDVPSVEITVITVDGQPVTPTQLTIPRP
ncbi:hypothetical protein [Rhabdothermincola salaria]|uniref:hypothetical protein n=1 Tax=Rhabdothermincola salaria TaxID=2903142 RepID=UPI001E313143|nr:hypothetical protein [Rhabdothermincola salaria]MCD9622650.1 hypothetical protein [Rhabdothermincola salaria]